MRSTFGFGFLFNCYSLLGSIILHSRKAIKPFKRNGDTRDVCNGNGRIMIPAGVSTLVGIIFKYRFMVSRLQYLLVHCLLIIFPTLFSCQTKSYSELFRPFKSDTTYTDIRREAFAKLTHKLALPSIQKGVNGFEMRIWAPHSAYDKLLLIIIKFVEGRWHYSSTKMVLLTAPEDNTTPYMLRFEVDSLQTTRLRPRFGSENFLDSLQSLALQNSPPQEDLDKGLLPDTGNLAYTFEIANATSYKMITFTCAVRERGPTLYDTKIRLFLSLLKKYFLVDFADCED